MSNNISKGGIGAELVKFNKSKSSLGNHGNTGIRRNMSNRRFPLGKEKYASMTGVSNGGNGTAFISSSLGKVNATASPPLKSFFSDVPDTLKLVLPPRELEMNKAIYINLSTVTSRSFERKQLQVSCFALHRF